jgi:hypothetical protein
LGIRPCFIDHGNIDIGGWRLCVKSGKVLGILNLLVFVVSRILR